MNRLDISTLRRIGGGMGSNPAGIFEDDLGQSFYVKTLDSEAIARNEILAARLYQLAGAPILTYVDTTHPLQVATRLVRLDKKCVAQLDDGERRQAQHWFGVHAWTANWDCVGFHGENQGVVDGRVMTLDLGGALEFRAMGNPKGRAFGPHVGEIETLRRDTDNPMAVSLFGDMDDESLKAALQVVTRIPDALIRQVIADHGGSAALADKMLTRKADMARQGTALRVLAQA